MVKAPCKGCQERYLGCHANCEKYKEFKAETDAERDARAVRQERYNDLYSYKEEKNRRLKR